MREGTFARVDWAGEEHAVCVVDGDGRIVEDRRHRHDERGIRALCARLTELGAERVAIEHPDGLPGGRLLDAGLSVIATRPNQVAAVRPHFSAAGGKHGARLPSSRAHTFVPRTSQSLPFRGSSRHEAGTLGAPRRAHPRHRRRAPRAPA